MGKNLIILRGGINIKIKHIFIVVIILTAIFSWNCVSAAYSYDVISDSDNPISDSNSLSDLEVDTYAVESTDISNSNNADLDDQSFNESSLNHNDKLKANDLGAGENGTFADLHDLIESADSMDTLYLDKDYYFDPSTDEQYVKVGGRYYGITIDKIAIHRSFGELMTKNNHQKSFFRKE